MQKIVKHILRDLTRDRHRAFLSMLAMVIGMSAFGIILFCYSIIVREIPQVYSGTNPVSASLQIDKTDKQLENILDKFQGLSEYQISGYYNLRVKVDNKWKTLELFASDNYTNRKYNKPNILTGTANLNKGEALIERDAISIADADVGQSVEVMLNDTEIKSVELVGSVNDLSVHPATMHNVVYLYVNFETIKEWGLTPNKIEYVVSGGKYNRENILRVSDQLISLLDSNGYTVSNLKVDNTPGESMHMQEYEGALFLLQVFSVISLIFGCMIMSNLINSILTRQIRQVGVIKAIGGTYRNILVSYLLSILGIVFMAISISIVLVVLISGKLSGFLLSIGNMIPKSVNVPWYIWIIFVGSIFLIPLFISIIPVAKGLRISIKKAISDYGISNDISNKRKLKLTFLSGPVVLSIRNAFRKKSRLILNVFILTFAGAMFIAVLSNLLSVQNAIDKSVGMLNYDYEVTVNDQIQMNEITDLVESVEEIQEYEVWDTTIGEHIYGDGQTGNSYSIISLDNDSKMIEPIMLEGRWINANDEKQIVVTENFLKNENQYSLGDIIGFQVAGKAYEFEIVGILNDFNMAKIYMNRDMFETITNNNSSLKSIKLATSVNGGRKQKALYSDIDKMFEENGIYIYISESIKNIKDTLEGHYSVTLQTFLIIIILVVAIAGFGLAATMNAQTSERKKEIGIMKAIGASKRQIIRIITAESIFISLLSCIGAVIFGVAISIISIPLFGDIINVPLVINGIPIGISFLIWAVLAFIIGYLSSRKVAKHTSQMRTAQIFTLE